MPRLLAALNLGAVIAAGLAVQLVRDQPWADAAGSVLYALAACCAGALVWRGPPVAVAGAAFVACTLVELAQLTGIPARLPGLSLLLGSTFAPADILWYAVGSALGAGFMLFGVRVTASRLSASRGRR